MITLSIEKVSRQYPEADPLWDFKGRYDIVRDEIRHYEAKTCQKCYKQYLAEFPVEDDRCGHMLKWRERKP